MSVVAGVIRREIQQHGAMSLARFMELALYHPDGGYYERDEPVTGRRGDFATNVSVGTVFGELLGFGFARWIETLGPGPCQLVEAGAHDGRLAGDILHHLDRHEAALRDRLEYVLVEPSRRRRAWQERQLADFGSRIRWVDDLAPLVREGVKGVIFSNELLDAMPLRLFAWDRGQGGWCECGVGLEADRFVWSRLRAEGTALARPDSVPDELLAVLPDGYVVEECPAATAWWAKAATALKRGWLLTFDYGLTQGERLIPERTAGTLRGYSKHRAVGEVLTSPGEQDLTAHVDFTALQAAGERVGLETDGLWSQGTFLTRLLADLETGTPERFPEWTPARRRQFLTLTHPQHFGRAFRVLVQHRFP
ncbi:MAG: class I SAM-dependent methyltransferase [Limisphaerales bacterium]